CVPESSLSPFPFPPLPPLPLWPQLPHGYRKYTCAPPPPRPDNGAPQNSIWKADCDILLLPRFPQSVLPEAVLPCRPPRSADNTSPVQEYPVPKRSPLSGAPHTSGSAPG